MYIMCPASYSAIVMFSRSSGGIPKWFIVYSAPKNGVAMS